MGSGCLSPLISILLILSELIISLTRMCYRSTNDDDHFGEFNNTQFFAIAP